MMAGMTGARRQTFLIDPQGRIAKHYEEVAPATHAAEVLADLRKLVASEEAEALRTLASSLGGNK